MIVYLDASALVKRYVAEAWLWPDFLLRVANRSISFQAVTAA